MKAAFLTTIICLSCASSAKAQDYAYSYDFYQADNITELLMGTEVPPRKKFIYDHAREALLDV